MKENSSKNDKYIEIIATNVVIGFDFLDDGSILYKNGDGTLYLYDGNEIIQVAKYINYYYKDENNRIIYETGDYSSGYVLYGVKLDDIDNKIKLISKYSSIRSTSNFDDILYTVEEDDGTFTLYTVGFDKENTKLAERISIITQEDGKTYFVSKNKENALNLYDYVIDDYKESDAKLTCPKEEDYSIPIYKYEMITDKNDWTIWDYDNVYTSCTKDLYWFGMSSWWHYSMEEALERNWGDLTDEVHKVTQNFIDKFADSANEEGYILLTDEVKAALKEIHAVSEDYSWDDLGWLWLCYQKKQSGTKIDYDAYNAAYKVWSEASERIEMREELKANYYDTMTLYCYEKGELTTINENVADYDIYNGAIIFNTVDSITDTLRIEDVEWTYDVIYLFYIDYEKDNYFLTTEDTTICKMSPNAKATFSEVYNDLSSFCVIDNKVYINEWNGSLSVAEIKNNVVEDFTIITDDAEILYIDAETIYYRADEYQYDSKSYYSLYSYKNGEKTKLAEDIITYESNIYSDGVVIAHTGYGSDAYRYEVTIFNPDGTKKIIGEDIIYYIRIDKH